MAKQKLERLIGRAVLDPKFREKLFADPEKAIREAGFDLTAEEMAGLKKLDPQKSRDAVESLAALDAQPWGG